MIHSLAGMLHTFAGTLRSVASRVYPFTSKCSTFIRTLLVALAVISCQLSLAQQEPPVSQPAIEELQVNVNEADAATIADILVGIGASRARAIVEYREENGPFTSLEDLTAVNGVGEATVNNNRERIRFD